MRLYNTVFTSGVLLQGYLVLVSITTTDERIQAARACFFIQVFLAIGGDISPVSPR